MNKYVLPSTETRNDLGGAAFSLGNRLFRIAWGIAWLLLCRWTPPPLHGWRCTVLRLFGATIGRNVRIWSDVRIWHPGNLVVGDSTQIGRGVFCYNQGLIEIGRRATISWEATLCSSTHDYDDPYFQLYVAPIRIGDYAWVAAQSFVGPGVEIGEGALLGARGVATKSLEPWTIYSGGSVTRLKLRDKARVSSLG